MKKGFTLVELIATVALLGILLLFSYSKVSDISEKKQKELLENKKTLVINAAKEYINNTNDLSQNIGDIHCIGIDTLENENLVPVDIEDLKKKYSFVRVIIGSKNSYNLVKTCDLIPPVIQGGTESDKYLATAQTISIKTSGFSDKGIENYQYYISNNSTTPSDDVTPTGETADSIKVTNDGTSYVWFRTKSKDGNVSKWSNMQTVKFKKLNIYVVKNADSTWFTDNHNYPALLEGHNVKVGSSATAASEIPAGNYDVVIIYYPYWALADYPETWFNQGHNIITIGDDYDSTQIKFLSTRAGASDTTTGSTIIKRISNDFTKTAALEKLGTSLYDYSLVKFNDQSTVFYGIKQPNGDIYDLVGAYTEGNKIWIHSEHGFYTDSNIPDEPLKKFLDASLNYIVSK